MGTQLTVGSITPRRLTMGRTGRMMSSAIAPAAGPVPQTMPNMGGGMDAAQPMGEPQTENGIQDTRGRTHQLSVSQTMDPALNRRAFPNAAMGVSDAINAGFRPTPWQNSTGAGPGTRGYRGSDTDGDGVADGHVDAHVHGDTMAKTNYGAKPYSPLGVYPRRADGGPVKRASGGAVRPSIQPERGLQKFYDDNPTTEPAYVRETTKLMMNPKLKMPIRMPTAPPLPARKEGGHVRRDTRAPVSRAGRTGGLASYYNDQRNLNLEHGARGGIDPITGLSHTPTQKEINDQLGMIAAKPAEFPGFGGLEESLLLSDYYNAKQAGDMDALAQARDAVVDFKNKLNALRSQQGNKYEVNEEGQEAYQPEGGKPELIPGGEHVQSFPKDGKVIPAGKTAELAAKGQVAPPSPEIARAAQASEKVAPPIPKTEPSAIPQSRTAQMMDRSIVTPYGKGSVTFGPRLTPSHINMTDTYDPQFAQKGAALDEASKFAAVEQPMPDNGEGAGFKAVAETPQQAWQKEAGRTVQLMNESKQRREHDSRLASVDAAMSKGKFTPGQSTADASEMFSPVPALRKIARSIPSLYPVGALGGR